jgi:hypothetical protein
VLKLLRLLIGALVELSLGDGSSLARELGGQEWTQRGCQENLLRELLQMKLRHSRICLNEVSSWIECRNVHVVHIPIVISHLNLFFV